MEEAPRDSGMHMETREEAKMVGQHEAGYSHKACWKIVAQLENIILRAARDEVLPAEYLTERKRRSLTCSVWIGRR